MNVAPLVADEPFKFTVLFVHVNVGDAPAFASGTPVAAFTATCAVAEHPFAGSVTVNVYVPAAFTVGVALLPPEIIPGPFQLYVALPFVDEPFSVAEVEEQVSVCDVPASAFGAEVFELTTTCAVAEHPLEGSVTVSVYVPAALTVGVAVFPPEIIPAPVQLNVAPPVVEDPFSITEVVEQSSVCELPAFALGTLDEAFTTTWLPAVHPFDGSVTVSVYVPAEFTEGVAVFPPETIPGPAQLNVAPAVADEPFSVTEAAEQVSVCVVPAFASGAAAFEFTTTCAVAEHPFDGSVTVNVYVPAVFTEGVAVFPPETIPAPFQLNVAPLVADDPFRFTVAAVQLSV